MKFKKQLVLLAIFSIFLGACSSSVLKKDEQVIFFPTSAHQLENGQWSLPVHHWVFEKESNDISRKLTQKAFSEVFESLGVSEAKASSDMTKQRLMWFLVDNQRNKKLCATINNKLEKLSPSAPNGHATSQFNLPKTLKSGDWVSIKIDDKYKRDFSGEVQLIPETGLSIISDIDDTIKISNVLDKKELIKNTFVEPYQITKGFPAYYKKLKQQGAYFHYVSASPWQLYPSIQPFMLKNYPKGTISLRNFRLKDSSIVKFLQSSADYKTAQIGKIIKRYPKHQFILIGDSGEHDPEVYAGIYKQYPAQIKSIQIRSVEGSDLTDKRFEATFKNVPKSTWQLIATP